MKTRAVRIHGKNDLRLDEFELPAMQEDEILAHIISDSLCMSTYKAAIQGSDHKRVPKDIDVNPTITGHEFCGEIVKVGSKWAHKFHEEQRFTVQTALNYKGSLDAPGYSYRYIGGDATYVIIPNEVMLMDCLLPYEGEAFFYGSLSEPMSCIIGAFHASFHTKYGSYVHEMGIKQGGKMAILAGAGPMGIGAIDYALHGEKNPSLLVVTDIDDARLARAAEILSPEFAAKSGVELHYVNTSAPGSESALMEITGGKGFDDVFVFAPVAPVVEMGDRLLGKDGCMNFFAGPVDTQFSAKFNFYNVHYNFTHIIGTSGGNTDDMKEAISMMAKGIINPAAMITHIGGLNAVAETTLNLPKIKGGKKLMYTGIELPLTAIDDFAELGKADPLFAALDKIVKANNGLWCLEAEKYLLANVPSVE